MMSLSTIFTLIFLLSIIGWLLIESIKMWGRERALRRQWIGWQQYEDNFSLWMYRSFGY